MRLPPPRALCHAPRDEGRKTPKAAKARAGYGKQVERKGSTSSMEASICQEGLEKGEGSLRGEGAEVRNPPVETSEHTGRTEVCPPRD
jgi:hypothetical protein